MLYLKDEALNDKTITFTEELPIDYLNSLYEDFVYDCKRKGIQLLAMIPIIDGELRPESYISRAFRYYKGFDFNLWLINTFSKYELVFKNDRFHRFKRRRKDEV